jgi:hypothetical protein
MIKNISGGKGLVVSGGSYTTGSWPYINMSTHNINMTNHSAGDVRYNGTISTLEVYDGMAWLPIQSAHTLIEFDPDTYSVLDWARKKQAEEAERNRLAETNPTMKSLIAQLKEKEDQIEMVKILLKNEVKA